MIWESKKVATIWGNIKKLCNGAKEKSFHFSSNGLLFDFFFLKKAKDLGLRWRTEKHCCIKSFQGSKGPQFYAKRNNPLNFFLQNNIKKLTKNSYIHTDLSDWSTNMVHQIDPHQPIHHINLSNWSAQLIHLIDQSNWFIYLIFYNYPLIDSPNWPTRLICSIRFFSFLLCSVLLCFEMEWFWGNI